MSGRKKTHMNKFFCVYFTRLPRSPLEKICIKLQNGLLDNTILLGRGRGLGGSNHRPERYSPKNQDHVYSVFLCGKTGRLVRQCLIKPRSVAMLRAKDEKLNEYRVRFGKLE